MKNHCSKLKVCFILANITWASSQLGILFVMGEESEEPHIRIIRRGPHLPNFLMELIRGAGHSRIPTPHRAQWELRAANAGTVGGKMNGWFRCDRLWMPPEGNSALTSCGLHCQISLTVRACLGNTHRNMSACHVFRSSPKKPNPYAISVSFRKW